MIAESITSSPIESRTRLKKIIAQQARDNDALKDLLTKKWQAAAVFFENLFVKGKFAGGDV
jgi:hypothetical protein